MHVCPSLKNFCVYVQSRWDTNTWPSMASESALTDFQIEGSHPIACMLFACGMHYNSLMSDHFQPLIAIISIFSPHIFDCWFVISDINRHRLALLQSGWGLLRVPLQVIRVKVTFTWLRVNKPTGFYATSGEEGKLCTVNSFLGRLDPSRISAVSADTRFPGYTERQILVEWSES